jgi:hypothetical protein
VTSFYHDGIEGSRTVSTPAAWPTGSTTGWCASGSTATAAPSARPATCRTPVPAWKRREWAIDALAGGDRARAADAEIVER